MSAARYPSCRTLQLAFVIICCAASQPAAHDAERTAASLRFSPDGSFVLDVANDADWLLLRLEPFAAGSGLPGASLVPRAVTSSADRDARLASYSPVFIDRVVLWIDGREVRPASAEYIPPPAQRPSDSVPPVATYRLRGHVESSVRSLRWYYGIVIDPYPLRVERADGRVWTETILGRAWSETIELAGQFDRPPRWPAVRAALRHGFLHVLPPRLEHTLFVVSLLLVAAGPRAIRVLAAFIIAHAAALAAVGFDVVSLPPQFVEPLLIAGIIYSGSEGLLTRRISPWRLALTGIFGIAFGLDSGAAFKTLEPLPSLKPLSFAAFAAGTLGGHLTVALAAFALARLLRRRTNTEPTEPTENSL